MENNIPVGKDGQPVWVAQPTFGQLVNGQTEGLFTQFSFNFLQSKAHFKTANIFADVRGMSKAFTWATELEWLSNGGPNWSASVLFDFVLYLNMLAFFLC